MKDVLTTTVHPGRKEPVIKHDDVVSRPRSPLFKTFSYSIKHLRIDLVLDDGELAAVKTLGRAFHSRRLAFAAPAIIRMS